MPKSIDLTTVSPSFIYEYSITPLNYITTITILNSLSPEMEIIQYFSQCRALDVLPRWLVPESTGHKEQHFHLKNDLAHKRIWEPLGISLAAYHSSHSIYLEMVYRMDDLERLLNFADLPVDITQQIRRLQDRYQPLTLYMEINHRFSDRELDQPENTHSPYKALFGPTIEFSIKDLPDLFSHVFNSCQFWGESIDKLYTNSVVDVLLSLIEKAWPRPCRARSIAQILAEILQQHRDKTTVLESCFRRFILASLLGIYPNCRVPAGFTLRRILYRYFYLNLGDGEWLENWIARHKYIVTYILREYLFYLVDQMPGFSKFLKESYYWDQILLNTYDAMDHVRSSMNTSILEYQDLYPFLDQMENYIEVHHDYTSVYFQMTASQKPLSISEKNPDELDQSNIHWHPNSSLFEKLEHQLDQYNKSNLNYCYRSMPKPFVYMVCHKMSDIENKRFDPDEHRELKMLRLKNKNNISTAKTLPIIYEDWLENLIMKCFNVASLPSYDILEKWFKVNLSSILALRHAQNSYESETDRSDILDVLKSIYAHSRRDFIILHTYFKFIKKRLSIIAYPLPYNIAKAQMENELRYYKVSEEKYLPKDYGTYFICSNCNEFKYTVSQCHISENYFTSGVFEHTLRDIPIDVSQRDRTTKVSLDLNTQKFYCSKHSVKADKANIPDLTLTPSTSTTKKGSKTVAFYETNTDLQRARKKRSRDIYKKEYSIKCPCEELTRVYMIGVLLYTDSSGLLVRCIRCPAIIKLSPDWHRMSSPLPADTSTTEGLEDVLFRQFTCNGCQLARTEEYEQSLVEDNKAAVSSAAALRLPKIQQHCCLCTRTIRNRKNMARTFLLDRDEETPDGRLGEMRLRLMSFCKDHEMFCKYASNFEYHKRFLTREELKPLARQELQSWRDAHPNGEIRYMPAGPNCWIKTVYRR